ncbi:sunset domain-containing protein [Kribbella sp. NPDC054772]
MAGAPAPAVGRRPLMGWLLRDNWLGALLAFLLGAAITWVLLDRRRPATSLVPAAVVEEEKKEPVLVGAATVEERRAAPPEPVFSQPMEPTHPPESMHSMQPTEQQQEQPQSTEPTLFDVEPAATPPRIQPEIPAAAPPGRYGEGSADAVPHQGPPDGFTIKGNAQSMLFHTPDSPYYGRTKPEVWFRSEADAERAGFTKYVRRPRKAADPRD